ncbi:hypothetical protein P8452_71461 [Trifolium repens]|nr:hypothetical protein P8452_71461 [Trifolium repens]
MGQLSHPNLVKLIGYCLEDDYPILVYEFLANGSLDNHLFKGSSNIQPLSWPVRMKIALDAAKGLAFLHSNEVQVMHGDFKTCNILIDSNHNAKLSDFGLDKLRDEEGDAHSSWTRVFMCPQPQRYAAPHHITAGKQTKMSDIYSFGVVLLEIMSGKWAHAKNWPRCERSLFKSDKAEPLLINKDKLFQFMDSYLEGQYSPREAIKVASIAIHCLSSNPKNRPNINEVVRSLEQL